MNPSDTERAEFHAFELALEAVESSSQHLMSLLGEELALLKVRDVSALEDVAQRKVSAIETVAAAWESMRSQLQGLGAPDNEVSTQAESYIERLPAPERVRAQQRWQQLSDLTTEIWTSNRINGRMLEVAHQNTSAVLNVLRGETTASGVYGRDGAIATAPPSRVLAHT
jgi:flagellar biosynthesis/type III secretory pathway chaperone